MSQEAGEMRAEEWGRLAATMEHIQTGLKELGDKMDKISDRLGQIETHNLAARLKNLEAEVKLLTAENIKLKAVSHAAETAPKYLGYLAFIIAIVVALKDVIKFW